MIFDNLVYDVWRNKLANKKNVIHREKLLICADIFVYSEDIVVLVCRLRAKAD